MNRIPKSAKRYGHAKTHLSLTRKAAELYAATDPLEIYEAENESDDSDADTEYVYYVRGCFVLDEVTEDELNAYFESVYDDLNNGGV